MFPLPASLISVPQPFACLFTRPTRAHVHVLPAATLLAQGPRTMTAALRATGLNAERRFERYHRVLNPARWSSRQAARILPGLSIRMLPANRPIVVAIDERLEWQGRAYSGEGDDPSASIACSTSSRRPPGLAKVELKTCEGIH
jgi:hypothetical protein